MNENYKTCQNSEKQLKIVMKTCRKCKKPFSTNEFYFGICNNCEYEKDRKEAKKQKAWSELKLYRPDLYY